MASLGSVPVPRAWPDRIRLPLAFAPEPLAAAVAALGEEEWTAHFVRANYDGDWSALALRAGASARHPVQKIYANPLEREWIDTDLLAAMPAFRPILSAFACPLTFVRLMRLTPGSRIKPHTDPDLDLEQGLARLHIPILTNADVDFRLDGTRIDMAPGSCWYLRLAETHEVTNNGTTDRVHLVIDTAVDDWLLEQLRTGVAAAEAG